MNTHAPLFLSHGSPMTALEPREAGSFMQQLGEQIARRSGRPRALLLISAHTSARLPVLLAGARHQAIYDFGGFDPKLQTLRYDAPGAPALAGEVQALLGGAGIEVTQVDQGGLDHGIWVPLRYLYPEADIPVLPLAFVRTQSPAQQFALGAALSRLAEDGVQIIGSGSITHNLRRALMGGAAIDAPEIAPSAEFRQWMVERSEARDWDALLDYRRQAPHALDMHPTDEHLLPWYVAAGAGGREHAPRRIHQSLAYGCLGMDAYAFGPDAEAWEAV
ncbi:class III extradiol ring-cleavage dioxygenase [Pelomonas sp. SE-A7]|uniref:dioxygenase family protein n=1 Tax=Pelomonas sp. SE-A7 TaxID=3054953 RepID=UPI00259CA9B7|nr:class III extradiol ring-cleavage dioxygenase [Pelomonas sp. SE-A7]MDM4764471.1 class III extradiol ring-cleavage dioxygenase [Pelomonas sp. SE-A7]